MTEFFISAGGVALGVAFFAVLVRLLEMFIPDAANYLKQAFDAPVFS